MNLHSAPVFPPPPRLALVIGSGGVRGASAIGVVDVLSRAGLQPDAGAQAGPLRRRLCAAQREKEERVFDPMAALQILAMPRGIAVGLGGCGTLHNTMSGGAPSGLVPSGRGAP